MTMNSLGPLADLSSSPSRRTALEIAPSGSGGVSFRWIIWLWLAYAGKKVAHGQVQMDIEPTGNPGFVNYVPVQSYRKVEGETRHCLPVRDNRSVCTWEWTAEWRLPWFRPSPRWIVKINRDATSFLHCLEFGATLRQGQNIDRNFSRLTVELQLE